MDSETEAFVKKYLSELREDNTAVFVGAGLSKAAGFVDWPELMSTLATDLGLDAKKESDLVSLAQFHVNSHAANRHQLSQLLIDQFSDLPLPTENHIILAHLPIRTYWTTNYDRLIEKALEAGEKRVDAKYVKEQLATTRKGRDVVVYKMHGDIEQPHQAILTKDDYEKYYLTHAPFVTALAGDLVEKTFLFIGFSFRDPNLDYVLGRIRVIFSQNQRQHFCLMREQSEKEHGSYQDYRYALTRQALMIQDLKRFNITTILVKEYMQVTELLKTIERRFRLRTVFISGSSVDYGSWGREATERFLARLAGH